jgi:hypothetical protein
MDTNVLVRLNLKRIGLYRLSIVLAGSRGELDSGFVVRGAGDLLAEGLSAEVLRSDDCSLLGTVVLSHEASVIYVDAQGKLSVEPRSVFWEEPPAAIFREIRDAPSACPGAWQVEPPESSFVDTSAEVAAMAVANDEVYVVGTTSPEAFGAHWLEGIASRWLEGQFFEGLHYLSLLSVDPYGYGAWFTDIGEG